VSYCVSVDMSKVCGGGGAACEEQAAQLMMTNRAMLLEVS